VKVADDAAKSLRDELVAEKKALDTIIASGDPSGEFVKLDDHTFRLADVTATGAGLEFVSKNGDCKRMHRTTKCARVYLKGIGEPFAVSMPLRVVEAALTKTCAPPAATPAAEEDPPDVWEQVSYDPPQHARRRPVACTCDRTSPHSSCETDRRQPLLVPVSGRGWVDVSSPPAAALVESPARRAVRGSMMPARPS